MDEKLLDFIQAHLKYPDREQLREIIGKHREYGTMDWAVSLTGDIVGFVRWNVSDDGTIGEILDLAIAKAWRNKGVGRDFIVRAIKRFQKIERLRFKRGYRDPYKEHIVNINRILKMKKGV